MSLGSTLKVGSGTLPATICVNIGHYRLVVERGSDAGKELGPLGEHTLIGRAEWADFQLSDPVVSAQHCELLVDGASVCVRDLHSTNGTFVGPVRVTEAYADPAQPIRVGDTVLRLITAGDIRAVERHPVDPTRRLFGASAAMQRVFGMMRRVAPHELPILLLGETGVGKTAVASAMHELSSRRDRPFVVLNCAAMPADLVETTLFGHVRGAYTGASTSSAGIFEQAEGGSVLLDEIGELPVSVQPKLLRVLETGKVRRVGGDREIDVSFRLFAATNRKLFADVTDGRFRQDLYFRVAGLELEIPPLRARPDDIELLAKSFIHQAASAMSTRSGIPCLVRGLSVGARRKLEEHSWPGNVRELQNVIMRAMALCEDSEIEPEAILLTGWADHIELFGEASEPMFRVEPAANTPRRDDDGVIETFRQFRERILDDHGREYVERMMRHCGGNVSRAAELAGVSRTYFRGLIRKYAIS